MLPILCTLIYVQHRGQILMLRRVKAPNLGLLTAPGGKLEPGEAPIECAVRELWEETGIRLPTTALTLRAIVNDEGPQRWLMFIYLADIDSHLPRPTTIASKEGQLTWVEATQVLDLEIPASDAFFYPRVMDITSPIYQVKFFYDASDRLIDRLDFS